MSETQSFLSHKQIKKRAHQFGLEGNGSFLAWEYCTPPTTSNIWHPALNAEYRSAIVKL